MQRVVTGRHDSSAMLLRSMRPRSLLPSGGWGRRATGTTSSRYAS